MPRFTTLKNVLILVPSSNSSGFVSHSGTFLPMTHSDHRVTKTKAKAKTRAKRLARKTSQTILGFVWHPLPVTCLDCGFLALGDEEVTRADRTMLHCEGSAGLPCSP